MGLNFNKSDIENIVRESKSVKECLEKMGRPSGPGNYRTFYRLRDKYDLDTSHFSQKGTRGVNEKTLYIPLNEYVKQSRNIKGSVLLTKLVKEGYKEYKCENPECGISEWCGKPITLQIHHIDGNHNNNTIENLMILCPNCHSQTDSFCGRGKKYKKDNFCKVCGKPIHKDTDSGICVKCRAKMNRKTEWPTKEKLSQILKENKGNFTKVSKIFGVSDSAIRKWCKHYSLPYKSIDYK